MVLSKSQPQNLLDDDDDDSSVIASRWIPMVQLTLLSCKDVDVLLNGWVKGL